ncbi:hypothetical protein ACJX0J_018059, partial [Zea mays]
LTFFYSAYISISHAMFAGLFGVNLIFIRLPFLLDMSVLCHMFNVPTVKALEILQKLADRVLGKFEACLDTR